MTRHNLATPSVAIVHWPTEADNVAHLRAIGAPRLLLLSPDEPAPTDAAIDEDWIRMPAPESDVLARANALAERAKQFAPRPEVRGDGRIEYRGSWVALSQSEECAAKVLTEHFRAVVDPEAMVTLGDHTITTTGVRTLVMRIRRRIEPLGLVVRTVHGRGYVMEPAAS